MTYRDPFSPRAEQIARAAIARADELGMEHYGPAPAPLDETRDMYREAIEELYDAIYYLCRQVARLEDQRRRLADPPPRAPRAGCCAKTELFKAWVPCWPFEATYCKGCGEVVVKFDGLRRLVWDAVVYPFAIGHFKVRVTKSRAKR